MRKLYFIWTNGYNLILAIDEDREEYNILTENNYFPPIYCDEKEKAQEFLNNNVDFDAISEITLTKEQAEEYLNDSENYIILAEREESFY